MLKAGGAVQVLARPPPLQTPEAGPGLHHPPLPPAKLCYVDRHRGLGSWAGAAGGPPSGHEALHPAAPEPRRYISGAPSLCLSHCTPNSWYFWEGPETLTLWSGAALREAGGLSPFTWAAGRCGPPGRECRGRPGGALWRDEPRGSRPGAARRPWWSPHRTQVPTGACPASAPAPAALASSPSPPWRCLSHSYLLPQEEP